MTHNTSWQNQQNLENIPYEIKLFGQSRISPRRTGYKITGSEWYILAEAKNIKEALRLEGFFIYVDKLKNCFRNFF